MEGGRRVSAEGMKWGKINGEIRCDQTRSGGAARRKRRRRQTTARRREISTINHGRRSGVFQRWPGSITNGAACVQLGGTDTADFKTEKSHGKAKMSADLRGEMKLISGVKPNMAAELIYCNSTSCLQRLLASGL